MKRFKYIAILLVIYSLKYSVTFSQPWQAPYNLVPPISGTLCISGAFGEVRTDHFHSGVDFRTGGKVGVKVFSAEKGYVSRIKISGSGFGKAIYINHPNGLTTAYAHLDRFTDSIEDFIKERQYREESFEVDVYLKPYEIRVSRGEFIAWSGNSGSSGGPHLHYEVRKTLNQNPLNPHFSNIPLIDSLSPLFQSVWIYPTNSSSTVNSTNKKMGLRVQKNGHFSTENDTIAAYGEIGIGVEVYDYVNQGSTRCGVYEISMFVNDSLYYNFKVDEFSFSETRYANSHIDYEERQLTEKKVHQLFLEPNNKFSGYKTIRNNGQIEIRTDCIYRVKVVASDAYDNKSHVEFILKGEQLLTQMEVPPYILENGFQEEWLFYQKNELEDEYFSISIPENALYQNLTFTYGHSDTLPGAFSPVIHIHNRLTPIHRAYVLKVKAKNLPDDLHDKALLGSFDDKGKIIAAGGEYSEGNVIASLRNFGDFFILTDTLSPEVIPLNISKNKEMNNLKEIRFRVTDDLSGIGIAKGLIDGKWALFEHDPKNDLIYYKFDRERIVKGNEHTLNLTVEDKKGNVTEFECNFFW